MNNKQVHLPALSDPIAQAPEVLVVTLLLGDLLREEARRVVERELVLAGSTGPGADCWRSRGWGAS